MDVPIIHASKFFFHIKQKLSVDKRKRLVYTNCIITSDTVDTDGTVENKGGDKRD